MVLAAISIGLLAACGGGASSPTATRLPTSAGLPTDVAFATPAPSAATAETPPSGEANVDACSLLTPADLNTATGKDNYAPGVADGVGGCVWNLEGLDSNQGDLVTAGIQEIGLDFVKGSFGSGGFDVMVNGHVRVLQPNRWFVGHVGGHRQRPAAGADIPALR